MNNWFTPAGLLVVFGAIIWGVQLNWGVLRLIEENTEAAAIREEILAKQVAVTINLERTTLLLSVLEQKVEVLDDKVEAHEIEAEKWKERIRRNSNDND
ncbi:MAG: hypothetical protein ACR2PH_15680 [Desulfobulbia bacterium]